MPFVQRVVSPTYVSRSRSRSRSTARITGGMTTAQHNHQKPHKSLTPQRPDVSTATVAGKPITNASGVADVAGAAGPTKVTTIRETSAGNGGANFIKVNNIGSGGGHLCGSNVNNDVIVNGDIHKTTAAEATSGSASTSNSTPSSAHVKFKPIVSGYEFDSVTNITLSNALRQLASLVLIANDIFVELNRELQNVGERSRGIKIRIEAIEKKVDDYDPKLVTVPESDLETFVQIKNHFKSKRPIEKELFTPESRSGNLRQLYDAAAKTPINAVGDADGDGIGVDGVNVDHQRREAEWLCTPVLGQTHRRMRTRVDVEIETRLPAAVEELRKWTSTEALGDITVTPDCISRVAHNSSMNNSTTFYNNNSTSIQSQNYYGPRSNSHSPPRQSGVSGGFSSLPITAADVTDDSSTVIGQPSNNRTTNEDEPLDHRLPSPEEQCQIIALKFPAVLVTVDTSGKRFERMCLARKSMMSYPMTVIGDHNNLNEDVQTVKRRSRSRKPRGKRRNTIAGTDQKEIEEAANGEMASTTSPNDLEQDKSKVLRSKSSDILKKDSPISSIVSAESSKVTTLTRFNSLKQWGRNRLRLINRSDDKKDRDKDKEKEKDKDKEKVLDIDDDINVYETVVSKNKKKFAEKERKLSHERKPSYSSSEKSLSIASHSVKPASTVIASASINPVKLRESSSIRRQRRSGLGQKDEPHSSSGNWSASSESGRTSIGSEITVQPKSSASSTSLNHSNLHPGSGPPSSVISRRRFLNTSASSSVTSEGTATPDLQMHDLCYDDETSSAYSCDTEGYYTSFHVDSGLKTLKEEEPMTPLHSTSALSSNNSFGSSFNHTTLTAENEYELFGRGSTSTTTSSAGTVCTTLMATDDKSSIHGPAVPERKSSLTKLNRSNSNTSNSTLERSYSSSTVGSTLERSGTIKRNGVLLQKEVSVIVHQEKSDPKIDSKSSRIESPDSGNNTSSSPIETNSNESPTQGLRSNSEFEYSECSDLEGVDRIERIRIKTTINSSRIPSMCIITPTTSDDETMKEGGNKSRQKLELPEEARIGPVVVAPQETDLDAIQYQNEPTGKDDNKVQIISVNKATGYATVQLVEPHQKPAAPEISRKDANFNHFKRTTLQPLNNMLGKLKGVLPHLKKSPIKEANPDDNSVYDTAGEYVTIADVTNNNNTAPMAKRTSNGIYYSNDVVRRNLATVLSGNLNQETEYVSLNELPCSIRCEGNSLFPSHGIVAPIASALGNDEIDTTTTVKLEKGLSSAAAQTSTGMAASSGTAKENESDMKTADSREHQHQPDDATATTCDETVRGARVQFDAHGKVVYNSDSLKRRKGAHTTFVPGPCVKDPISSSSSTQTTSSEAVAASIADPTNLNNQRTVSNIKSSPLISGGCANRRQLVIRPVVSQQKQQFLSAGGNNNNNSANNNPVMATGIIKSHLSSLDNDNLIKSASTPSSHRQHQATEEDYQRLSRKDGLPGNGHASTVTSSTLPRQPYGGLTSIPVVSPFQRKNQVYWTLQHKKQQPQVVSSLATDDSNVNRDGKNLDELYATPNKNRPRDNLRTTPLGFSTFFSPIGKGPSAELSQTSKISPIDPRNTGGFKTSTPSKLTSEPSGVASLADDLRNRLQTQDQSRSANTSPANSGRSTPLRGILEQQQPRSRHSWAPDNAEQSKTCSDRMGTPKTSLMDFKKLLLATSTKHTAAPKVSAVELLKTRKEMVQTPPPTVNSSLHILELSGSPKTFANRRMIRQGNFGSPSKSLATKQRPGWRLNSSRTDVMSTAIPEANSEEDTSSSNGSIGRKSPNPSHPPLSVSPIVAVPAPTVSPEKNVIEEKVDLKRNIFLQAEENNFMKGEIQKKTPTPVSMSRSQLLQARAQFLLGTNSITPSIKQQQKEAQFVSKIPTSQANSQSENSSGNETAKVNPPAAAPSLETAL